MRTKKERVYSRYAIEAAQLLGESIRLARKERHMTEADLADRAGITRLTLRKIERGDLGISVGFAFEVAALLGLKLFDAEPSRLSQDLDRIQDKVALLPKRIRKPSKDDVKDEF